MKTVEIKIENEEATMLFNGMLETSDFNQFWKGIDPDNNDGSDGSYSETVQKIFDIYCQHVPEFKYTDFQIWGPDPSFAGHIDPANVPLLVNQLKVAFPGLSVEFTGKTVDDLLEKWIVVQLPYADPDDAIRVTPRSNFEKMGFCKAYGDYGVQVDCNNAGCYSFNNTESQIFDDFYKEASETFGFNEDILDKLDLTHRGLYEMLIEPDGSVAYKIMKDEIPAWDEIIAFFKEWRKNNESHTEITGWTFHDSHNFKTVVLDCDFGEPDCTELDEEEQIKILLQMPKTAPHMEGFNTSEETEDFNFHFDLFATNPWYCYVEKK